MISNADATAIIKYPGSSRFALIHASNTGCSSQEVRRYSAPGEREREREQRLPSDRPQAQATGKMNR